MLFILFFLSSQFVFNFLQQKNNVKLSKSEEKNTMHRVLGASPGCGHICGHILTKHPKIHVFYCRNGGTHLPVKNPICSTFKSHKKTQRHIKILS